jgi:hypothetical protein
MDRVTASFGILINARAAWCIDLVIAALDFSAVNMYSDALNLQAPTKGEQAMTLYFICCNPSCGHRWRD